jgi:hypothetical protein
MPIKVEESVDTNDVINDVIIVSCTVDVGWRLLVVEIDTGVVEIVEDMVTTVIYQ